MSCQDGDAATRQMLYDNAEWLAEAESTYFMLLASEELPTASALLVIMAVPVQDWMAVRGAVPPGQPGAAA